VAVFSPTPSQMEGIQVGDSFFSCAQEGIKYLGFFCDPKLTGMSHAKRCEQKAKAMAAMAQALPRRMGPTLAAHYYQTHVQPAIMYATQFNYENTALHAA